MIGKNRLDGKGQTSSNDCGVRSPSRLDTFVNLIQESKNLFRLTRFGMVNCFLVREEDGLTLVDTGLVGSAVGILRAARTLNSPICRIVLTHAHVDHVGCIDALRGELPKSEFFVGQRESRLLTGDFTLEAGENGKKLLGFQV